MSPWKQEVCESDVVYCHVEVSQSFEFFLKIKFDLLFTKLHTKNSLKYSLEVIVLIIYSSIISFIDIY